MKILSQFIFEKLILAKQIEEKLILNKNIKIQNRNNIYKFIEIISYLYLEHYKYSNEPHYNILEIYKKIKNLIDIYELNNTKYNNTQWIWNYWHRKLQEFCESHEKEIKEYNEKYHIFSDKNINEYYNIIKNYLDDLKKIHIKYNIYSEKINDAIIIGFKKFLDEN